jgi:hypothetical protein
LWKKPKVALGEPPKVATAAIFPVPVSVRAFNGSNWGDWRKFTVNLVAQGPVVSAAPGRGEAVRFTLASNTFPDP